MTEDETNPNDDTLAGPSEGLGSRSQADGPRLDGPDAEDTRAASRDQAASAGVGPSEAEDAPVRAPGEAPDQGPPDQGPPDQALGDAATPAIADPDVPQPPLTKVLEAILLVVDEPVNDVTLAQVTERPRHEVTSVLNALAGEYAEQGRGYELREVAGGWRLYTAADCAPYVERFILDGQQTRLTQAALETLAVIAYRQPVTRARVAAVRGVNVDGVVRTLGSRGLIREVGADAETGGTLYETTSLFLEKLGINDVRDLPPLAEHLPDVSTFSDEDGEPST